MSGGTAIDQADVIRQGDLVVVLPEFQVPGWEWRDHPALVIAVNTYNRRAMILFCGGEKMDVAWRGLERIGSVWDLPWPERRGA